MDVNTNDILKKAYEFLEDTTPLYFDCGRLCEGICCRGSESDGMLLFPCEEELFENDESFTVYFDKRYNLKAVSCKGHCERNKRPLSCRIFPYMFYLTEKGTVTVAPDIRATEMCPVLYKKISPSRDFMRKMRMLAKLFETSDVMKEYLGTLTEMLTDFGKLE